jgi:VIT1/CCC1 family predicted Fe2+/Mn2+ transporter
LAGGVSMALGGYLSARTERELLEYRIATEQHEIRHEPEEERAELRAIYHSKGMRGRLLEGVVEHLTADEDRWLRAMVHDELGVVAGEDEHPWLAGTQVGLSFVVGGLIPSLPFLLALPYARWWAFGLTGLTALTLGALKSRYTLKGPIRAGLEFLGVVTVGMLAGVVIGALLHAG